MSKPTFVFLFTLTCLSALCAAEELNIAVLIRGLNHANRTIQSGEVRALVTDKHYFGQTEKEIEDWIKAERKRELERFKPHPSFPDIGPKEFEEEYLEPLLEFQANSSREYITIYHATSLFRLLSRNSPRLYQYKLTQQEVEGLSLDSQHALRSQNSTFFIFSHDSKKQVKQTIGNAVYPTAPRQSVQFFSTSREHFAFWDFYYLGRSGISVPPETKYIGDETVDGTPCHVLECTSKHKFIHRLWV